jgi:predicted DNA-binding transcriptional regulator AlpA
MTRINVEANNRLYESGYIRLPELKRLLQWSASTVWRKSKDGSFVRPIRLSQRITAWSRSEVNAWLALKVEEK